MAHPAMASVPLNVLMNQQAAGAQMPAYLTVPEPMHQGQGTVKPLMFTLLRAVLKAGGHALANYYDHNPVTQWVNPPR